MISLSLLRSRLLGSTLFKDSFWSLLGSVVGKGLSVVAGIMVARFLGKEIYGEYGILRNTLIYIEIFSTFGLGYTATKFVAQFHKEDEIKSKEVSDAALLITLLTSTVMACFLLIFSKQIADIIDAPHLHNVIKLLAIGIIPNAINVGQIGILSGYSSFKIIAKNTVYCGILTFVFTVLFTLKWGLIGSIVALVISYSLQCLFNFISIKKLQRKIRSIKVQKQTFLKLVSYSLPIALQEGLYSVTNWLISFILIKLSGYGELGMYTAAIQITAIMGFIPSILSNVTLSHFAHKVNDSSSFVKTRKVMMLTNLVSTTGIFLVILVFANSIASLFGSSFNGLSNVFYVSCFTAIIASLSSVYVQECLSSNHNWFLFVVRVLRDFSTIAFGSYLLSIYKEGALYMCLSILSANILYFVVLHLFLKRHNC